MPAEGPAPIKDHPPSDSDTAPPLIVGGGLASAGEYPYFVSFQTSGGFHFCGGTLIASDVVLTAGHCVDPVPAANTRRVRIGGTVLSNASDGEIRQISSIVRHPSFTGNHCPAGTPLDNVPQNDVALLFLTTPSTFPWTRLGDTGGDLAAYDVNDLATAIGHGDTAEGGTASDALREVSLPVRSDAEMEAAYNAGDDCFDFITMTGAGPLGGGQDTCQGDSGGPLFAEVPFREVVMGVTSYGFGCARDGFPGVYAEVYDTPLRAWIESQISRPANDTFATPTNLGNGAFGQFSGDNTDATNQSAEPGFSSPENTVWYSWTAPASGPTRFTVDGQPDFDSTLAVFTGTSLSGLTSVATNDDFGGSLESAVTFNAVSGTTYRIQVDGFFNDHGPFNLQWAQNPPPNDDFANATVLAGPVGNVSSNSTNSTHQPGEPASHFGAISDNSVWFSWTPASSGPATLSLQGSAFDTAIQVYTGSSVTGLTAVAGADDFGGTTQSKVEFTAVGGTTYRIAVDGFSGSEGFITLGYVLNPVANDDFDAPTVLSPTTHGTISASTVLTVGEPGEPSHGGAIPDNSAWFSWTPPESGPATISLRGSTFDTGISVSTGTAINGLTLVASADDFGGTTQSKVDFTATAGTTYRIGIDGFSGTTGGLRVQWAVNHPANDDLDAGIAIGGATGSINGNSVRSTAEPGEPNHHGSAGGKSVWYSWTAPTTQTVSFNTVGSGFDTLLAVYTGSAVGSLTSIASNDDIGDSLQSRVTFPAVAGTVYKIAVDGFAGASGPVTLAWAPAATYLSVGDVTVAEGNAGSTPATFTITRSGATAGPSTVSYTTPSSGSATAGSDYTAVPATTVSFASGETTKSVPVSVLGDTAVEANETFTLVLSAPTGATLSDSVGAGTIVNDDALPRLAVSDVTGAEGNTGTRPFTFTITRSGATTGPSTVSYTTSNGAATAGTDYTAVPPTTVSFAAGENTKTVTVNVLGDTASEASEAFYLVLSAPTGAMISDSIGTGLIVNDDALPTLAVGDVSRAEGNAGSAPLTFTITRSGGTTGTSSVSYTTTAGTATAGSDYTAIAPTRVTFNPGETTKTVAVTVFGDTASEANETFSLVLSSPAGATLSDTTGPATILNDDGQPTLAVADVTVTEGNAGSTPATFTITRTGSTTGTSTVSYTTPASGTAAAGSDYTAIAPTTVSFAPGETSKTVTVNVVGDTTVEANEYFYLALSAPTGATLADYLGIGHIVNDEGTISPGPSTFLSVGDVTVAEGNTGSAPATFTISRRGVTTGASTVSYTTTPGTAAAGTDYTAIVPTTLTFAAGETTKTVTVNVLGDSTVEANEAFSLTLSSPSGATVSDTTGIATIANDDALPTLAVSDVTVAEGNSGSAPATFTISRTGVTTGASTVSYATTPGTAAAGTDYTAIPPTTVTFAAGEITKTVTVNVLGDTAVEANEYFYLVLSAPTGATLTDNLGPAFIVNDDPLPTIAVSDVTVAEGNTGTAPAAFTITRTGLTTGASTVSYTTTPGTATAGTDYTAIAPTTLTFAAGETTKTVSVNVLGDTAVEALESFFLTLSAPTGATLSDTGGMASIVNDDATTLSVSDVSVTEGNAGTTPATFTITRSGGTTGTSTVSYTTTPGTATPGTDYTAIAPTTLTFSPGETTKTVIANVTGDTTTEPNETFTLVLSTPTNATLSDNVATATIQNDD